MKAKSWKSLLAKWLLVGSFLLITQSSVIAQNTNGQTTRSKLWKQDRERLALAIAKGQRQVRLLIASAPGRNQNVAGFVKGLGGSVEYQADEVDYLRVKVLIEAAEKIAAFSSVQAIAVAGAALYTWPEMHAEGPASFRQASTELRKTPMSPRPDTPTENPYLATQDIGAPQFIAKHPTFDGRGVTVGIVELMPDFLISELQTAKGLDGSGQRKIVGVADMLETEDDATTTLSPSTVETHAVHIAGGQFTDGGLVYSAPGDGNRRFGFFNFFESQYVRKIAEEGKWKDLSLYQGADGKPRPVAVLWDEASGRVWVDTNQNHDFRDEKALRDYNSGGEVGVFGKDDPATPWRESLGFIILADARQHRIRIELGASGHTTGTATAAVGKGLFGTRINGTAPEARLFPVIGLERQYALIEGTLLLMRNPDVDVLWTAIGFVQNLSEAESTLALIWSRITTHYKKLIFAGAGNLGAGSNTIGEPSASNLINVGGYIAKDTWWSNLGMEATRNDYVPNLPSRGPAANGAFKPDLLAPMFQILPNGMYFPQQMSPGGYKLPLGYRLGLGTSATAPMAAGAAALLISAAKQSGVKYDAERLSWAMKASARYLDGWAAHEQGAGLINIEAAWELLKRAPELATITSRGSVSSFYGRYLQRPNEGPGIYEREGWRVGQSGERVITFTRANGGTASRRYLLSWQGNDGTFATSSTTVKLAINQEVSLPVRIHPQISGIHSATLSLAEESTGLVAYRVMTTVVAAEDLGEANRFRLEHEAVVEPLTYTSWFIRVPEGASELKLESPNVTGGVTIKAVPPWGVIATLSAQSEGAWETAIEKPVPGVWEIVVEQKNWELLRDDKGNIQRMGGVGVLQTRMEPQSTVSIHLAASVIGIENAASASAKGLAPNGPASNNQITFLNRYGELKGSESRAALGAMRAESVTLTAGELAARREIEVAPNTGSLQVSVSRASDRGADADLYLYDCTDEKRGCEFRKSSAGAGSDETITIDNPAAGKWVVVIDSYDLPNGKATLEYKEVMTNTRFGTAAVTATPATLAPAQQWKVGVTPDVKAVPTSPRRLCAVVTVVDQKTFEYRKAHLSPAQVPKAPGVLTTVVFPVNASSVDKLR
jgi:Subtilase family/Bacterial pre-peptidase C-terminal domain